MRSSRKIKTKRMLLLQLGILSTLEHTLLKPVFNLIATQMVKYVLFFVYFQFSITVFKIIHWNSFKQELNLP